VVTFRHAPAPETDKHEGEVFSCAYTPDGAFVLSAGWDGYLRLWEVATGAHVTALRAGNKPLSACTISPDGKRWVAGSMEGLLSFWDAHTHQLQAQFVGHTRPISAVRYSPDGQLLASASWDRQVNLRNLVRERDSRTLSAHEDIVSGCGFSPDGNFLLSWSHDRTLKWWDLEKNTASATLEGHKDRVTTADLSPDGVWAASGSRNGEVVLWDLERKAEAGTLKLGDEVRACFFLRDGAGLLVVEASGRLTLYSVPDLQLQAQQSLRQAVQCGALAPGGNQVALGGEDGAVRLVVVEGYDDRPLVVTAIQGVRVVASRLQKFFGRSSQVPVYSCTCPACRKPVERLGNLPDEAFPCPHCRRPLRFNRKTLGAQKSPC
jgi:WD40 repeat protein